VALPLSAGEKVRSQRSTTETSLICIRERGSRCVRLSPDKSVGGVFCRRLRAAPGQRLSVREQSSQLPIRLLIGPGRSDIPVRSLLTDRELYTSQRPCSVVGTNPVHLA